MIRCRNEPAEEEASFTLQQELEAAAAGGWEGWIIVSAVKTHLILFFNHCCLLCEHTSLLRGINYGSCNQIDMNFISTIA